MPVHSSQINSLLREEASDDEDDPVVKLGRVEARAAQGSEDGEEFEDHPYGNAYPRIQQHQLPPVADSPPPTPSTVAGMLSDIGLDDTTIPATRSSVRRNRNGEDQRRDRDDEELSDGDGSVYSELSIG